MLKIEEALELILKNSSQLKPVEVDLLESLNHVIAEDIFSKEDIPHFDKSAMDGYVIKAEKTHTLKEFQVVGVVKAGDFYEEKIEEDKALKIMTGAAVPIGLDCVVQIEKNLSPSSEILKIDQAFDIGNNIIKKGSEIKKGELAIGEGTFLRPSHIGFLASLGHQKVKVYPYPKVTGLITGDELLEVDEVLQAGKIRNSNSYSLKALCKDMGIEGISTVRVSDTLEDTSKKLKEAFKESDIVMTSGGASVGEYDFVKDALKSIGATIHFEKVSIKPGKPLVFATYKDKLFFGIPGNPLSLITIFEEFIKPSIYKVMGKDQSRRHFKVVLKDDFKVSRGRTNYVYCNIEENNGVFFAYNLGSQCSNQLSTISTANGIIIVSGEEAVAKRGDTVYGKYIFEK